MARDLAVIIPHFQDIPRLRRCLTAFQGTNGLDWTDVVVVHSGETNHDFEMERAFPWVRFLHTPDPGAGPARNFGVASTSAPLLLFVDCDCVPDPNLLNATRNALRSGSVVGGRITLFDENSADERRSRRTGPQAFETVFAFRQKDYVRSKRFAVTACLATTRQVFDAVGPFRVNIAEDKEWCHRATAQNHPVTYGPRMAVGHPTRATWRALTGKWRRLIREDLASTPDGPLATFWWIGKAALLPFSLLRDLPRIWLSPRLNGPLERIKGSATLIRLRFWRSLEMLKLCVRAQSLERIRKRV